MILVTGGTGLVGSHLMYDLLKQGKKVRALRRKGSKIASVEKTFSFYSNDAAAMAARIEWVEGDVLDVYSLMEAMEGVEQVYHSAAMISFVPADEQLMLKINVEGTANVVNAALEKKIRKLCHVSSIAALGTSEKGEIISEESYWKSSPGNSNYSISKYGAEREVWRGIEEGLCAVIVNPSIVIGNGSADFGSTKIFNTIHCGLRFYSSGENGWVDVRDVVRCMIELMDGSISSERFILSAENNSFRKVFEISAEQLGKRKPFLLAGKWLAGIAWRADKIRSSILHRAPVLTRETARSANQKNKYSNEKIRKAIGFQFMPLETSLREHSQIFLKEKKS